MKQHITAEQLQELTPEQQQRLREWWKPQNADQVYNLSDERLIQNVWEREGRIFLDYYPYDSEFSEGCWKDRSLPILSIGQCIELLLALHEGLYHGHWSLLMETLEYEDDAKDLIDALWKNIKEIL